MFIILFKFNVIVIVFVCLMFSFFNRVSFSWLSVVRSFVICVVFFVFCFLKNVIFCNCVLFIFSVCCVCFWLCLFVCLCLSVCMFESRFWYCDVGDYLLFLCCVLFLFVFVVCGVLLMFVGVVIVGVKSVFVFVMGVEGVLKMDICCCCVVWWMIVNVWNLKVWNFSVFIFLNVICVLFCMLIEFMCVCFEWNYIVCVLRCWGCVMCCLFLCDVDDEKVWDDVMMCVSVMCDDLCCVWWCVWLVMCVVGDVNVCGGCDVWWLMVMMWGFMMWWFGVCERGWMMCVCLDCVKDYDWVCVFVVGDGVCEMVVLEVCVSGGDFIEKVLVVLGDEDECDDWWWMWWMCGWKIDGEVCERIGRCWKVV